MTSTCPACGDPWVPWEGSKLATHARCHFTPAARADILAVRERFPHVAQKRMAADLGVSVATLRATLEQATIDRREGLMRDLGPEGGS